MEIIKDGAILYSNAEIIDGSIHAYGLIDNVTTGYEIASIDGAEIGDLWDGTTLTKKVQTVTVQVPMVVTIRQARRALHDAGLLVAVDAAILNGADEVMKIDWQYATEVRRDWNGLAAMATALNITDAQLDALFVAAASL